MRGRAVRGEGKAKSFDGRFSVSAAVRTGAKAGRWSAARGRLSARGSLRTFCAVLLCALALSGCGGTKYQSVDMEKITEPGTEVEWSAEEAADDVGGGAEESEEVGTAGETGESGAANGSGADEDAAVGSAADTAESETGAAGTAEDSDKKPGAEAETETEAENESESVAETESTEAANVYRPVNDTVVVNTEVLNVRMEPDTSARIYVQLKEGETLRRISVSREWCQVLYNGKVGYVATDMVTVKEEETTEAAEETVSAEEEAADEAAAIAAARLAAGIAGETEASAVPSNGHTVAIDAGGQAKSNSEKEPVGPGSATMRVKMEESVTGTATGQEEYELTLAVAKKAEAALTSRGYAVVMIRNGSDVNLSNSERAVLANRSGAEIYIRIHANSMENSGIYGALAMCMTSQNPYNAGLYEKSSALARRLVDQICAQTGTKNRGVQEVDNSTAINWSEIPVSDVAIGFLSNPDEDRWLADEDYRQKLANGIADAVDAYFAEGN